MAFGIALYVGYRLVEGKPILKRVTIPERALTRRGRTTAEYGSILVPVLGTPLDDDIMQTAGRLSMEENADEGEGGAVIEAVWVFEVPMALPLDARIGEDDLKRARKALQRAKAVGEEYQGVEVATATVRARRAGEGIVREAKRRGVEAIVLAAEEPTRMRGGPLLGGKRGLYDTFVGQTTRYVVTKAPCRVILTAPPGEAISARGRRAGSCASPSRTASIRCSCPRSRRPRTAASRIRTRLRRREAARVRADVRARRRFRQGRVLRGHRCAARGPQRLRARRGPALP